MSIINSVKETFKKAAKVVTQVVVVAAAALIGTFAAVYGSPADKSGTCAGAYDGSAKPYAYMLIMLKGEETVYAIPSNALPAQALPSNALPAQAVPSNALPAQALPSSAIPSNFKSSALPSNALPAGGVDYKLLTTNSDILELMKAIPSNAIPSNLIWEALPAQALPSSALPVSALPAQAKTSSTLPSGVYANFMRVWNPDCESANVSSNSSENLTDKLCEMNPQYKNCKDKSVRLVQYQPGQQQQAFWLTEVGNDDGQTGVEVAQAGDGSSDHSGVEVAQAGDASSDYCGEGYEVYLTAYNVWWSGSVAACDNFSTPNKYDYWTNGFVYNPSSEDIVLSFTSNWEVYVPLPPMEHNIPVGTHLAFEIDDVYDADFLVKLERGTWQTSGYRYAGLHLQNGWFMLEYWIGDSGGADTGLLLGNQEGFPLRSRTEYNVYVGITSEGVLYAIICGEGKCLSARDSRYAAQLTPYDDYMVVLQGGAGDVTIDQYYVIHEAVVDVSPFLTTEYAWGQSGPSQSNDSTGVEVAKAPTTITFTFSNLLTLPDVCGLWVRPAGAFEWGGDLLSAWIVNPQQSKEVEITADAYNKYDLKILTCVEGRPSIEYIEEDVIIRDGSTYPFKPY